MSSATLIYDSREQDKWKGMVIPIFMMNITREADTIMKPENGDNANIYNRLCQKWDNIDAKTYVCIQY